MTPTLAQQFLGDSRVEEARRLVLEALAEHQCKLTGVRPPAADRAEEYHRTLERFAALRGGKLYYPYLGSGLGNGALVELADGSVKYDMITGIGVHGFGHSHRLMVEAAFDAALRDTIMQGNLQQDLASVELSELLVETACERGAAVRHCFLSTSGAMANENALKLMFHKRFPADRLLAFENCFAGRTLALSQVTDRPAYRKGLPRTVAVDYVPFYDAASPEGSIDRAVAAIESHIARYPGGHAGMVVEVVQGEGGYYPGTRGFFLAIIEALRRHGLAVFLDEVQTFGRTTRPFAFQHFELDEFVDIVSIGKLSQVCATLFTDAYAPAPGLISQTFTGATSSMFAAIAILRELREGGYFGPEGRIAQVHERFARGLEAIAARRPGVLAGPYGLGSMIAFTPFEGTAEQAKTVSLALFERGVIAFIAGQNPARVRFLPPVGAITDAQIDEVLGIVEETLVELAEPLLSRK